MKKRRPYGSDFLPYPLSLVLALGLFLWQVLGRRVDDDVDFGLNKHLDDMTLYMQDLRSELHSLHSNHTRHLEHHILQLEQGRSWEPNPAQRKDVTTTLHQRLLGQASTSV